MKKIPWALLGALLSFYLLVSWWGIQVSPFPGHGDGSWYDGVARNFAAGRGLTEDCLWHFAIPRDTVSGPIGNYWNPLVPLILGTFYKVFGVSNFIGVLPALLMDAAVALFIFFFAYRRFGSKEIAAFSFLLYSVHTYVWTARAGGGTPETFLAFFVALTTFSLIAAWEGKRRGYILAGLFGALAYLSRNEGGMSLLAILFLFFFREIYQGRWLNRTRPRAFGILGAALATFALVVAPWEIRNRMLFGEAANAAKTTYFFVEVWDDVWSYSRELSFQHYLALGWKKILTIKLSSYVYKIEMFTHTTSWPILMFIPSGLLAASTLTWIFPVMAYFLISFLVMGFLNSVGQQGGWNGIAVFLPIWIPLAVAGSYSFFEKATKSPIKSRWCAFGACFVMVLYHLAINVRVAHHYKEAGNLNQAPMLLVQNWLRNNLPKDEKPIVMTSFPHQMAYFTGIPSVIIPTNDPPEIIQQVAHKFGAKYLVLMGDQTRALSALYKKKATLPAFTLLADIPFPAGKGAIGDPISIYRIH